MEDLVIYLDGSEADGGSLEVAIDQARESRGSGIRVVCERIDGSEDVAADAVAVAVLARAAARIRAANVPFTAEIVRSPVGGPSRFDDEAALCCPGSPWAP
jgi:hypothetical protein